VRIIGGKHKGRKLVTPQGSAIRPTSERNRESIFNILSSYLEDGFNGKIVVDLFAGTGSLGLEAMSRGAQHAIFVDNDLEAISIIKKNVSLLEVKEHTSVLNRDASHIGFLPLVRSNANLVFLDPPYKGDLILSTLRSLANYKWLAPGAICVVEASTKKTLEPILEFKKVNQKKHGKTMIYILKLNR